MEKLYKLLTQLGFNERETDVYVALCGLGQAKATVISRASKQPRTRIYQSLEALEERGLIARTENNGVLEFFPNRPDALLELVMQRMGELDSLKGALKEVLPLLAIRKHGTNQKPIVQVSHGMEAMKMIYREILSQPFISIFNPKLTYERFGQGTVQWAFGRQVRLRARELIVDNEESRTYTSRWKMTKQYQYRILPAGIQFDTDIMVTDNLLTLFFYDDEFTVVRIDNPRLTAPMKNLFEFVWKLSGDPPK